MHFTSQGASRHLSAKKEGIRFSKRVTEIQTSPTLVVMNRAKELAASGIDVVDFGPGEPDFATPLDVAEAGKRAIDEGKTKYTNTFGTNEIRQAIAWSYNRRWETNLGISNVIAGNGGKQELFNLMLALVSPGDEVIIPSPYWVSFPDQVHFAEGTPVFAPTELRNHFRPTFESIRRVATARTRGIILNSPSNPTGAVIDPAELEKIIEFCHSNSLFLVFDETYEFFVYDGNQHVSAMRWYEQYQETVISVNSMSKTFAMTGWRLGFAAGHPDIIAAIGKIQSHSTSNPSSISQAAALVALGAGDAAVKKMYRAYAERREWLVRALGEIEGMECPPPDGAFYVFPGVTSFFGRNGINDSHALAEYLLEEAHVAVVPGSAFGGEGFIRISYATSMQELHKGVSRMKTALAKLR